VPPAELSFPPLPPAAAQPSQSSAQQAAAAVALANPAAAQHAMALASSSYPAAAAAANPEMAKQAAAFALANPAAAQQAMASMGVQGDASSNIGKAGLVLKLMAILQNPKNTLAILKAPPLTKATIKEYYGTDDPKEVSKMIFSDLQDGIKNGTWSIGRMAFFGGAYGVVMGGLSLLPPGCFLIFVTPIAGINMVFILAFSFVIMTVESSGDTISGSLKNNIFHWCKALETIWGRGFLYLYVGVSCLLAPGHALFGCYMLFVGAVYLGLYKLTALHMQKMKEAFKDPKALKLAFDKRAGLDQVLDRLEFIKLLKEDLGMEMSHAELEMMMTRIDGNHDNAITLAEMTEVLGHQDAKRESHLMIKDLPSVDTTHYNVELVMTSKTDPTKKKSSAVPSFNVFATK
jgi:hypothetical protein